MTIGPAPIKQMDSRSGRLGKAAHRLHPLLEDRPGVVRPRAGLGMELHGSGAQLGKVHALDGAVIERNVGRLTVLAWGNGEAVVLARDEHTACGPLQDGVIGAAVAELELE